MFLRLGVLALALILFMTFFRVNLYFLSVFHATAEAGIVDVLHSFLAGLRFDILVFGFLFIPIYFLLMLQAFFEKWPRSMFVAYKFYFVVVWFAICALTFIDFFTSLVTGRACVLKITWRGLRRC